MHHTKRLSLSPYLPQDLTALYEFMSDAQAMQHTYIAASLRECAARLEAFENARLSRGFAPWVLRQRQTTQVIGWGGLCIDPEAPQWGLEVIYALAPAAWGNGYATELVQHAISHAFDDLHATELNAFVRPENAASARVLRKCGFDLLRYEASLERHHYRLVAGAAAAR